jgi:aspartate kinase
MKYEVFVCDHGLLNSSDRVNWLVERMLCNRENKIGTVVVIGASVDIPDMAISSEAGENQWQIRSFADMNRASSALFTEILKARGLGVSMLDERTSGVIPAGDRQESRIRELDIEMVRLSLEEGKIPVVMGSFALDTDSRHVFLGPGGAEALAIGIASSLENALCVAYRENNITSSLIGVSMDTEEDMVLSYQECMEMIVAGEPIVPARVIELAEKKQVPLRIIPFYSDHGGVLVMGKKEIEGFAVSSVVSDTRTAKIAILGVPDVPGIAAKIFSKLADADISAEMIIQSVMRGQINDIAFLVRKENMEQAIKKCRAISKEVGAQGVNFDTEIARVSLIGSGIANHPDIPSKMFSVLAEKGINLEMIVASSVSITCVVDSSREQDAVNSLKDFFGGK